MSNSTQRPLRWIDAELARLEEQGLRRRIASREGAQSARLLFAGREVLSFGSNDYLGLAADPRLAAAAAAASHHEGWGSGASPLLTGHATSHRRLEAQLAEFEGTEAALLFSSGFAANVGAVAALVGAGDVVFNDAKNHASLLDGARLSRADVRVYPHADWQRLDELLARSTHYRRRLVVTDALFSMDGDLAPLAELAEVTRRHDAMLMVDEAHATGVFGRYGRGVAECLDVENHVDVRIGTLSKALGCVGGFVAGSRPLVDWLVSRARSYIFSTAAPAAMAAAAAVALDVVRNEPQRREGLLTQAEALRGELTAAGCNIGRSASQIIPIVVGDAVRAVELSAALLQRGLYVPAVRPPTVPEGEACLRISLTSAHTPAMVAALTVALRDLASSR